jgi:hypothetical protein
VHVTALLGRRRQCDAALRNNPMSVRVFSSVDHYKCYRGGDTPGTPRFQPHTVTLDDAFETKMTVVKKPALLCNAVDKNGEGIHDPTAHLECYTIKDSSTPPQSKFAGVKGVSAVNEFGIELLDVSKSKLLCVPAQANGVASALNLDHFKCYSAKPSKGAPKFTPATAALADQFETKSTDVVKPVMLCAPTAVNGGGVRNPQQHLECYQIKDAKTPAQSKFQKTTVTTTNEFGTESFDAKKPAMLCVPSRTYLNPVCGDNVVDVSGEECDGTDASDCGGLPCLPNCQCTAPSCGDNIINQVTEQCDGFANFACGGRPCQADCTCAPPGCGDGIVDSPEQCDGVAGACPGSCKGDCTCPICGDNVREGEEQCDGTDDAACPGQCSGSCSCPQLSPVTDSLITCQRQDTWQFSVNAAQNVVLVGDTADAATAADLCLTVSCTGGDSAGADDNNACTFPPPAFACPRASFVANSAESCTVVFRTCSSACANPNRANYSLRVTLDGTDTTLIRTANNQ